MSIPTSDNTSPVGVTMQPDWSKGVKLTYAHATKIFTARTGHEQRQRGRLNPKAKIEWETAGLSLAEALAALTAAEVESRRLCIVPFWCEATVAITSTAGDTLTIGVDPRPDFFVVGDYIFLDDGTTQDFRQIATITDRILTLTADVGAPEFAINTRVYPCRKCRRLPSDEVITRDNTTSHSLRLAYETTS